GTVRRLETDRSLNLVRLRRLPSLDQEEGRREDHDGQGRLESQLRAMLRDPFLPSLREMKGVGGAALLQAPLRDQLGKGGSRLGTMGLDEPRAGRPLLQVRRR